MNSCRWGFHQWSTIPSVALLGRAVSAGNDTLVCPLPLRITSSNLAEFSCQCLIGYLIIQAVLPPVFYLIAGLSHTVNEQIVWMEGWAVGGRIMKGPRTHQYPASMLFSFVLVCAPCWTIQQNKREAQSKTAKPKVAVGTGSSTKPGADVFPCDSCLFHTKWFGSVTRTLKFYVFLKHENTHSRVQCHGQLYKTT